MKFINDESGATAVELVAVGKILTTLSIGIGVVGFVLYCLGVAVGVF